MSASKPPDASAGEHLQFDTRAEFRKWLAAHHEISGGVWLIFGKPGGPSTLSAVEALEEALCFGWIDGQMRRLDETRYLKYFARRRSGSKWSDKNKGIVAKLEAEGLMTEFGRTKVDEAKQNGQWDQPKPVPITADQIKAVAQLLQEFEPAYTNFRAMSPSVQRTYARAYFDAKTDAGRTSRLAWMVDRLGRNLKPM